MRPKQVYVHKNGEGAHHTIAVEETSLQYFLQTMSTVFQVEYAECYKVGDWEKVSDLATIKDGDHLMLVGKGESLKKVKLWLCVAL